MAFVIKQVLKAQNTLGIEVLELNWVLSREFLAFQQDRSIYRNQESNVRD